MPSPDSILGYCTNVHAGTDYASTLANLERYALPVKQQVSPNAPMGVGLWLAASAAQEMLDQNRIAEFRVWLEAHGLLVFTMNGFPYGDFHQTVVKHAVTSGLHIGARRLKPFVEFRVLEPMRLRQATLFVFTGLAVQLGPRSP